MASRVKITEDVRKLSGKVHIAASGYKVQVVQPGTTTAVTVYQAATGGATHSWFGTDSTGMIVPFNADPSTTGTAVAGGELWVTGNQNVELRVLTLANVEVTREWLPLVSGSDAASVETGLGSVSSATDNSNVTTKSGLIIYTKPRKIDVHSTKYGAVGDGVADDGPALALAAADARDDRAIIDLAGADYLVNSGSGLLMESAGMALKGNGPGQTRILRGTDLNAFALLKGSGTIGSTVAVTVNVNKYDETITMSSTSGLAKGDYLRLRSEGFYTTDSWISTYYNTVKKAETVRIKNIDSGTQVTLWGPVSDYYPTSATPVVQRMSLARDYQITDLSLVNNAPYDTQADFFGAPRLAWFSLCRDPVIGNVHFQDGDAAAVELWNSVGGTINGKVYDLGDRPNRTPPTMTYFGYGVAAYGVSDGLLVDGLHAERCRHAFTTGVGQDGYGAPRNMNIVNGVARDITAAAWDTHPFGDSTTFKNCHTEKCKGAALQLRGPGHRAIGCTGNDIANIARVIGPVNGTEILGGSFQNIGGGTTYGGDNTAEDTNLGGIGFDLRGVTGLLVKGVTARQLKRDVVRVNGDPETPTNLNTARCQFIENTFIDFGGNGVDRRGVTFDATAQNITGFKFLRNDWIINASANAYDPDSTGSCADGLMVFNGTAQVVAGTNTITGGHVDVGTGVIIAGTDATRTDFLVSIPGVVPGAIDEGEEVMPRLDALNAVTLSNQALRLTYFTKRTSETISQVRVITNSTAAGATPTLVRFGIYTVAANGDLTLVASTPNDTTLLAATTTRYTKSLSVPYAMVAGRRYAFAALVVTGATAPTVDGLSGTGAGLGATTPVMTMSKSGLSDLPSTATAASLSAGSLMVQAHLLR